MSERDPRLDAVLASGVKLPAPSATLLRLQALATDDNAGPGALAAAIGQEPALTGEFMRVANSPVFRTRTPVRSVKAAITVLGRTRTMAVVASHALRAQTAGIAPRAVERVWSASAAAADNAYRAARVSRVRGFADLAYLAALVHDVGIAIVLRRFPEHAGMFETADLTLDIAAQRLDATTGAEHAAVAALVARNWKLPPDVAAAVAIHHKPAAASEPSPAAALAAFIAVARRLRDGPGEEWPLWAPLAEAHLDIGPEKLEALSSADPDED